MLTTAQWGRWFRRVRFFLAWYMQFEWTSRTNKRSNAVRRAKHILSRVVPSGRDYTTSRLEKQEWWFKSPTLGSSVLKRALAMHCCLLCVLHWRNDRMFPLWGTSLHNHAVPKGILSNKLLLAKSFLYQPHHNAFPPPNACITLIKNKTKINKKNPHHLDTSIHFLSHPRLSLDNPEKILEFQ